MKRTHAFFKKFLRQMSRHFENRNRKLTFRKRERKSDEGKWSENRRKCIRYFL